MTNLKNARRQSRILYILAGAFTAAFLLFGIGFVSYAVNLSKADTVDYIQQATHLTTVEVNEHIDDELNALKAAAVFPDDKDLLAVDPMFYRMVERLTTFVPFVRVGLADPAGDALWTDDFSTTRGNIRYDPFFAAAFAGEAVITETRGGAVNGLDVNYYAVPVYKEDGNTVRGVLFAAAREDELREIIDRSLYAGKGLAHIIDSRGDYVIWSNSPLVITNGDNVFNISNPLRGAARQAVADDFAAGRSGHLERNVYGDNRLVAYEPLAYNGWLVFYAVPESMVNEGMRKLEVGVVVIIAVASCIFALFIALIRLLNNRRRKELEHMAFVDPVTGRGNYQQFLQTAEEILKDNRDARLALCYADIIGFKYVNDLFGRDVGDRLLRYWSDALEESRLPGEAFARVSADIFVALCRCNTRGEIEMRMKAVGRRVALFPETFERGYRVELNCGVYLTGEQGEALAVTDMLDRANTAQKIVKERGNGERLNFYSDEMREKKLWETKVTAEMERALENGEFVFYLQPKIDIVSGGLIGAEALVRWNSPAHGLVSPGRFVSLFERNGFIMRLDRYIFEQVCQFYQRGMHGDGLAGSVISVNVSRLGLHRPDFITTYAAIRRKCDIPDGCIELEFTESLVFENSARFQNVVSMCKSLGFLCSLDDFGSGYSSLNILKSLRVDALKLDRQFFQYGSDAARGRLLVRDIISMAKDLGMHTLAEGIETEAQVDELRGMGCDAVQGFVYGKPMPPEEFLQFAKTWAKSP